MANITKNKRDQMLSFLEELKTQHTDDASIRAFNEIENQLTDKKFGLVFEEHTEEVDEMLKENIPVLCADKTRRLCKDETLPWNFIIEGDNLQALYLLEKTHRGKVDCIYIDPPYNSGAKDWKYNNNYIVSEDEYRHSKWLSMMKARLVIAKRLLNPSHSVLICTIDEKEYLHLGCMIEELFPNSRIQMISDAINPKGVARNGFSRNDEYIFCVMFGDMAPARLPLGEEWSSSAIVSSSQEKSNQTETNPGWTSMMRRGSNSTRSHSPGCYYPIYVDPTNKKIVKIGQPVRIGEHKADDISGLIQVLPIRTNLEEGCWQVSPSELKSRMKQGRIKLGRETHYGYVINYLPDGAYASLLSDDWVIEGKTDEGSIVAHKHEDASDDNYRVAPTQWKIASHNSSEKGSSLIAKILCSKRFTYPKSLYSEYDTIRFFVENNPDAIVVDFFAGSGTTQHAVNLINATDGGNRRCIMVTNNEVSAKEEETFTKKGIKKGDSEWENYGIAKYVTWPRTVCSINGCDVNGKPLEGTYGVEIENYIEDNDSTIISNTTNKPIKKKIYIKGKKQLYPQLADIKMSQGFSCNVKYFKCDWTPRKPDDYLLSNALCLHIKEMIELQNAIEVDNIKNVIILNKKDFKKNILNPKNYSMIENLWVNQNMILNADEMKLINAKGFKCIPREFFGQELKEVAE